MHLFNLPRTLPLFVLILISACSSRQTAQQPPAPVPGPGFALVYFYRTQDSPSPVGVDIKDNGIDVGTLQNGTYFVYHANSGQHLFTAIADTSSTQKLTLQGGATYYIKVSVVSAQHLAKPSLNVVFNLEGQAAIQNLKRLFYHE